MANFVGQVYDINTKAGVGSAHVVLNVSVSCNWPASGSGYGIDTYTDGNGRWASNDTSTSCNGSLEGTISANGYYDYPINTSYGNASGDIGVPSPDGNVYLTPVSVIGGLPPPGQGFAWLDAGLGSQVSQLGVGGNNGILVVAGIAFAFVIVLILVVRLA